MDDDERKRLRLLALSVDLRKLVMSKSAGTMHSLWDVLADVDAFVKGQPTIVTKPCMSADEWISYVEGLLEIGGASRP